MIIALLLNWNREKVLNTALMLKIQPMYVGTVKRLVCNFTPDQAKEIIEYIDKNYKRFKKSK